MLNVFEIIKKDKFPLFLISLVTSLSSLLSFTYNKLINDAPIIKYTESFRQISASTKNKPAEYEYTFEITNLYKRTLDSITLGFFYVTGGEGRIIQQPTYEIISKEFSEVEEYYTDSITYRLEIKKFASHSKILCTILVNSDIMPQVNFFPSNIGNTSPIFLTPSLQTFLCENETSILITGIVFLFIAIFIFLKFLLNADQKNKVRNQKSRMYKLPILLLFLLIFKTEILHSQVNYIKSIVIKNGVTNSPVSATIFKKQNIGDYFISSEYNPKIPYIDSCDCDKTPMVKVVPNEEIFFKSIELPCREISNSIVLQCKRPFIGLRNIESNRGFNGTISNKEILVFKKEPKVDSLINKILLQSSLNAVYNTNKIIVAAASVDVAEAAIIDNQRYIFYNPSIFENDSSISVASIGIFAHELGHNFLLHDLKNDSISFNTRNIEELEADRWAGAVLAHLYDSLDTALQMFDYVKLDTTSTSITKAERIKYFELGWNEQNNLKNDMLLNSQFNNNFYYGMSLYKADNWAMANAFFDMALNANPKCVECLKYIGIGNFKLKEYMNALTFLSGYNKIKSEDYEISIYLAETNLALKQYDTAAKYIDVVLKTNPPSSYILALKSQICFNLNNFNDSYLFSKKSLNVDANNKQAIFIYGNSLIKLSKYNEAIDFYSLSISNSNSLDTNIVNYRLQRAICYIVKNKYDSALIDLSYANRNDPETYYITSRCYHLMGDIYNAKKAIAMALTFKSGNFSDYLYQSGLLDIATNSKKEGVGKWIELKKIKPDFVFNEEQKKLIKKYSKKYIPYQY
jgi:tetratricopeptide (TPR) repeat protein